jgi:hypothetical protein
MTDLKPPERTAIEAIAKRFSATWEAGSGFPHAWITVAGKRIALDLARLKHRGRAVKNAAETRLRFDKVATRLIERLRTARLQSVPTGTTVLVTITAPIRLPSRTAGVLEQKIEAVLKRRSLRRVVNETVHGNRVQIHLLRDHSNEAEKLIAFVHNPDTDAFLLTQMTCEMLELITPAGTSSPATPLRAGRIAGSDGAMPQLSANTCQHTRLNRRANHRKILLHAHDDLDARLRTGDRFAQVAGANLGKGAAVFLGFEQIVNCQFGHGPSFYPHGHSTSNTL